MMNYGKRGPWFKRKLARLLEHKWTSQLSISVRGGDKESRDKLDSHLGWLVTLSVVHSEELRFSLSFSKSNPLKQTKENFDARLTPTKTGVTKMNSNGYRVEDKLLLLNFYNSNQVVVTQRSSPFKMLYISPVDQLRRYGVTSLWKLLTYDITL